jgi:hypothetical protein
MTDKPPIIIVGDDFQTYRAEDVPDEFLIALAKELGYAVTVNDVRQKFGDDPLTPEIVLQALEDAAMVPAKEIDANTPDEELDRFLFGEE